MIVRKMSPLHPGTVLLEEYLNPMNLTEQRVAEDINIPVWRINEIIAGKRCITAETALRLGRYFSTPPQFWFGLQMDYDLKMALSNEGANIERDIKACDQSI
ncbi:MAG: HigA family addiction module antidote protein [Chlorobium sp.]|nr:MAG: HigA family addiction module antidote protein [Chlorobium sp.]